MTDESDVDVETLRAVLGAFNRHDLDAILSFFADDAVFESPRVSGSRGASEWTLTGTTTAGERIEVRGCDLWEFADGRVVRKDSYWKRVEPAT